MIIDYLKKYSTYLAWALTLIFAAQVFWGNQNKSLTWDEPSYISGGYTYLKWGDFRLNPSHPPLIQDLIALPLLFMDLRMPAKEDSSFRDSINPVVEFGYQFLYEDNNDFLRITRWARLAPLLFGSFLVFVVYLWGNAMYGRLPALMAVAVTAFSPNLLANAKLATEDIGCTTLMFTAVWMLWRSLHKPNLRNWGLCGLVTGLALLSKYTALLLGPIFIVLATGFWWRNRDLFRLTELLKGGMTIFAISFLLIGAGYNLSFDYSIYFNGMWQIYGDMSDGIRSYLFGQAFDEPLWYYYLVVFLLKVPVPVIMMIVAAGYYTFRNGRNSEAAFFLLVPAAVVIVASLFDDYNLGLRRILPAFPFLFLFTAVLIVEERGRLEKIFIGTMLCWTIFEAWLIYPHHITYFNTLAGGAGRGPELLHGANIDQGQDLPALAEWQKNNYGGRPIKLFYSGTADPVSYGVNPLPMDQEEIRFPRPGIYAISTNNLVYFRFIHAKGGHDVDWLSKYKPIAFAGNSIYIYSFD